MRIKTLMLAVAAVVCAPAAFSATQGEMSRTSSSAIFQNTFGETLANGRQVQVSMLKDAVANNTSPVLDYNGDSSFRGVRDKFCVVDTTGAAVNIKFQPNTPVGNEWQATAVDGSLHVYYITAGLASGTTFTPLARNGVLKVDTAATNKAACGDGNISKGLHVRPDLLDNKSYNDTVLVIVTPV